MQAPAVVHWGPGVPSDKLAYINDREEALIKGARKFKGRRDVGGIPAYPDPGDTAAGDDDKNYGSGTSTGWGGWGGTSTSSPSTSGTSTNWGGSPTGSPSTSGTSTGWGGPDTDSGGLLGGGGIGAGSGTSGGSPSDGGGGVASGGGVGGGFGSGDAGGLGAAYPGRGDYQGAYPSAAADIMAAARTLAPNSMSTPAQKAAFDKWRSEVGQRAINGFPDPAPEKTDREISIPTPGPAAIAPLGVQPGLSAPPAAPAVASTSSAPAGPPEGLLGPRSMSYGTQTSNFDVPVQSIAANTAAMTAPKIADRIAPSPGFGQSYPAKTAASRATYPSRGDYQGAVPSAEVAQPGPADIPAPAAMAQYPSRGNYGIDPYTGGPKTPSATGDFITTSRSLGASVYGPHEMTLPNEFRTSFGAYDKWNTEQTTRMLNGWEDPKPVEVPDVNLPTSFGEDWRKNTITGQTLSGLLDALPPASTQGPGLNPPVTQSSAQSNPNLPTAELTPINPGLLDAALPPATVGSIAPQMPNIGAKTEKLMQTQRKGGTPAGLDPFAETDFADATVDQDVVATTADPRALAGVYPSRGTPDPNASPYTGTPQAVATVNPSATSTPWGGYFDIPARTEGTTLPKNPFVGRPTDLRKQVLSAVNDAMPTYKEPVVGDTTTPETTVTDAVPPPGLLDGPQMGDVTPPPQDYFSTASSPRSISALAGEGGGIRQEALDNEKKALGGKKGGKKDDKPDDGTDTPGKGSRGRYGLPDWYWQWYRTAGQFGAPRGLLG